LVGICSAREFAYFLRIRANWGFYNYGIKHKGFLFLWFILALLTCESKKKKQDRARPTLFSGSNVLIGCRTYSGRKAKEKMQTATWYFKEQLDGGFRIWIEQDPQRPLPARNQTELKEQCRANGIVDDLYEDVCRQLEKGGEAIVKVPIPGQFSQGVPS
jgi:hypothetical protein